MTPGSRAEAHATKLCRQLEADLNWVRKRIPGRGVCDDLERIAAMLRFGNPKWEDTQDAAILDSLAFRLRELRDHLRGEGARGADARTTAAAIELGSPELFGVIPPKAADGYERVEIAGDITLTGSGQIVWSSPEVES